MMRVETDEYVVDFTDEAVEIIGKWALGEAPPSSPSQPDWSRVLALLEDPAQVIIVQD